MPKGRMKKVITSPDLNQIWRRVRQGKALFPEVVVYTTTYSGPKGRDVKVCSKVTITAFDVENNKIPKGAKPSTLDVKIFHQRFMFTGDSVRP